MKASTAFLASPLRIFLPADSLRAISSLASASRRIETRGPFPERYTLCKSFFASMCLVAISNPTRVFPAPGTPVTKQIAFFPSSFAFWIKREMAPDVLARFFSPASLRDRFSTEWDPYNAEAASIMVGVGQYRPFNQPSTSSFSPSVNFNAASMTELR